MSKKEKILQDKNRPIPLFWWSEIKFIFKQKENYGDLLAKYLVEKISGREVKWVHPKKQPWYKLQKTHLLAVGSILPHATRYSIVWGSGIIDREHTVARADFRAVRGPRTRQFLQDQGYDCPPVYGDPALLLPRYYNPQVNKKYRLGIIPHYHDFQTAMELFEENPDIKVIDLMCLDIEEVTRQILECEQTLSSSLHGLIISQAYEIPSIWIEFSDRIFGDGIKYPDYLESLKMPLYQPPFISDKKTTAELERYFNELPSLPEKNILNQVQENLLAACPFLGKQG